MFRFAPPDKQRPVLLLTRSDMIPVLNSVTVAPLTRTIRGVPSEVLVGIESGLKSSSAINLHHVVTVPKAACDDSSAPSPRRSWSRSARRFCSPWISTDAPDAAVGKPG